MPNSISRITRYRDTCKGWDNSADAPSLALDWNREWLIPANTNAWFPVNIFKDVALPGVYTVTVTGSTNVTVRYGSPRVRGGQSEEVDFPLAQSQETLEVQAAAPGAAALTVSFTGTGAATNYTCSTYVNIKTWGVDIGVDADYDGDCDAQDDPLEETQGGLTAVGAPALTPLDIALSTAGLSSGTLTLETLSGGDKIRVWTGNTTNSVAITLPKTWAAGETIPQRLWVQGLNHSDTPRDVSLRLSGSLQGVVSEDVVNLTVIQITAVELAGALLDGLVVVRGTSVTMTADIQPTSYTPLADEPKWYYKRLRSDGSWDQDWISFGALAYGKDYTHMTDLSGIFQIKAVLSAGVLVVCDKVYTRKTSEEFGTGIVGDPDAFGVVDTPIQLAIRDAAKSYLGSTAYALGAIVSAQYGFASVAADDYKCNIFIAHRAVQAGATIPGINGWLVPPPSPPSANQWAGTADTHQLIPGMQTDIDGWTLLTIPLYLQPGFIVAHPETSGSGHCGIVDYDGGGIAGKSSSMSSGCSWTCGTGTARSRPVLACAVAIAECRI